MRVERLLHATRVAGLAIIVPGIVGAQIAGSVIVTPYAGLYVPSTEVGAVSASAAGTSVNMKLKHNTGAALGANVSYWFNERFAIEGGAAYVGSDLKGSAIISEPGSFTSGSETEDAHIWLGSAKLMVQLLPPESQFNLRFGVGPAVISRGGSAYNTEDGLSLTGLTNYGGAMSLCSRLSLTRTIGLRLRAEDYMYQSKIGFKDAFDPSDNFEFKKKLQNDFVFSAGLQVFLGR
jgi:hypothetical protein